MEENEIINWNLLENKRKWVFKIPIKGLTKIEIQEIIENFGKKY